MLDPRATGQDVRPRAWGLDTRSKSLEPGGATKSK